MSPAMPVQFFLKSANVANFDFPWPRNAGLSGYPEGVYRDSGASSLSISASDWTSAPRIRLEWADDIIRKLDAAVLEEREEGEPEPTERALSHSKQILKHARPLATGFRFVASVMPLDGSVRITWQSSTRNVRLVCPAYSEPYIYYERLLGHRSVEWGSEKATSKSLTDRLRWLAKTR